VTGSDLIDRCREGAQRSLVRGGRFRLRVERFRRLVRRGQLGGPGRLRLGLRLDERSRVLRRGERLTRLPDLLIWPHREQGNWLGERCLADRRAGRSGDDGARRCLR